MEDDYGQFCIIDIDQYESEIKRRPETIYEEKTDYGVFIKTLYAVTIIALFVAFLCYI